MFSPSSNRVEWFWPLLSLSPKLVSGWWFQSLPKLHRLVPSSRLRITNKECLKTPTILTGKCPVLVLKIRCLVKAVFKQCAWSCSLLIGTQPLFQTKWNHQTTIYQKTKPHFRPGVGKCPKLRGFVFIITWKHIWRWSPLFLLGDVKNEDIYQPLSSFPVSKTVDITW